MSTIKLTQANRGIEGGWLRSNMRAAQAEVTLSFPNNRLATQAVAMLEASEGSASSPDWIRLAFELEYSDGEPAPRMDPTNGRFPESVRMLKARAANAQNQEGPSIKPAHDKISFDVSTKEKRQGTVHGSAAQYATIANEEDVEQGGTDVVVEVCCGSPARCCCSGHLPPPPEGQVCHQRHLQDPRWAPLQMAGHSRPRDWWRRFDGHQHFGQL